MSHPDTSPDPSREELHFRRIDMRGYRRGDGLYELEGRVTDRKPGDYMLARGGRLVPAGQAVHDMGVRLVFDDHLVIQGVTTFTDAAPYDQCPEGGRALESLIGVRMTSGWSREVRSRLGGERSCTHLRELLIPMATAAFQALGDIRKDWPEALDESGRPKKIDSCYAYGAQREVVRMVWPQFHRPAPAESEAAATKERST
jgi:hypothetical protein